MDVDSTLILEEGIDLLGDEAGVGLEVATITERAMRGELDFEEALRERVSLLKGLPESVFDCIMEKIHFTPGAFGLVRTKAGPLPGLTCWNSTTCHSWPSRLRTSPFFRSFVVATGGVLTVAINRNRPDPTAPGPPLPRRSMSCGSRDRSAARAPAQAPGNGL